MYDNPALVTLLGVCVGRIAVTALSENGEGMTGAGITGGPLEAKGGSIGPLLSPDTGVAGKTRTIGGDTELTSYSLSNCSFLLLGLYH